MTGLSFQKVRQNIFCYGDRSKEVHFHDPPVYFEQCILREAPLAYSAIVDQDVYMTKHLNGGVGNQFQRVALRQVHGQNPDIRLRRWRAITFHSLELVFSPCR